MVLTIELDQEEDGRWIAEVVEIPGALAYGATSRQPVTFTELSVSLPNSRLDSPLLFATEASHSICRTSW
jgi:hypothetical protein